MVTGSIYERKGIYYAIVSYYVDGRRKQKSVSTGLPVKGNKRRALEFLENLKRKALSKECMHTPLNTSSSPIGASKMTVNTRRAPFEREKDESVSFLYDCMSSGW